MPGSPVSAEVFAFVQSAQVAAGMWRFDASGNAAVASGLLEGLPSPSNDHERAVIAYVVGRFADHMRLTSASDPRQYLARREPIRRLMQMATDPALDIERAARILGWSKWHLCRVIRHRTGLTFTKLVNLRRVLLAVTFLLESTHSVKEIAALTGYRNTAELDRQFARWLHMTPTELRKAAEGAERLGHEASDDD